MKCPENGDFDFVYFLERLSNFEFPQTMRLGVMYQRVALLC